MRDGPTCRQSTPDPCREPNPFVRPRSPRWPLARQSAPWGCSRQVAQDAVVLGAGIDRSYFGKRERGERQPSLGIHLRVAGALGVSAAELVAATEKALPRKRVRRPGP